MTILSKSCTRCKIEKPLTDFYKRSGVDNPVIPGHYQSECKACIQDRSKNQSYLSRHVSLVTGENHCIEYLTQHGIYAATGKSVYAADVDVVAWGCVKIEVKHSYLKLKGGREQFVFTASPQQTRRGFLAHVVVLVCEYEDERTFHLFDAKHPVFYMHGRIKTGLTFVPGRFHALKHGNNRVVMTEHLMEEARDRVSLIEDYRIRIADALRRTA